MSLWNSAGKRHRACLPPSGPQLHPWESGSGHQCKNRNPREVRSAPRVTAICQVIFLQNTPGRRSAKGGNPPSPSNDKQLK